jgi:hypothetical protein
VPPAHQFRETLLEDSVRILASVVYALILASVVQAQGSSPKPPQTSQSAPKREAPAAASAAPSTTLGVDPAKEADIRRLLEVAGSKALMSEILTNMMANMKPMLVNSLPPGEYQAKLIDLFLDKFTARANDEFPKLVDQEIPIYDKYFSAEDIKGLIQFYQTPLGQKTLSTLPKIVAETQVQGQKLGEQIGRETMMQVLSEHPELLKEMEGSKTAPKDAK